MIRIWIKQVLNFLINLLWIEESAIDFDLNKNIFLKDVWVIGLYKYRNKKVKDAIWQLKFRANKEVAVLFGKEMAKFIKISNLENYIIVPIPIHWRRRMERGFNQTEWLCKEIVRANKNLKYINILKRSVYSQKQSWNRKQDRQKNIKSVFEVRKKYRNKISGRKFMLIDDVVTTGATLNEARKELEKFSPDSVKALTVGY
jgi:competence protein ComFC